MPHLSLFRTFISSPFSCIPLPRLSFVHVTISVTRKQRKFKPCYVLRYFSDCSKLHFCVSDIVPRLDVFMAVRTLVPWRLVGRCQLFGHLQQGDCVSPKPCVTSVHGPKTQNNKSSRGSGVCSCKVPVSALFTVTAACEVT
jgi:hypothetical protein